jgi:exodeoxyribonuclease V gamma subunit
MRSLAGPRALARWREDLAAMLAAMVASDARTAWQHQRILDALGGVLDEARAAGFDAEGESVDLAVVRSLVDRRIDATYPERGFLQNGVTFCAMVPMRSIPFRVVCLVGMNDGAYPRPTRVPDFDLVQKGPGGRRTGDRDRRKDDRFLFLEALMAARERVIVTYTGQSIRDNSERPPSVVVGELLDRIEQRFELPGDSGSEGERGERVRERVLVRHPLQAFSTRYFDGSDPRLFSHVRENLEGARHLGSERRDPPALFSEALPPIALDGDVDRAVSLAELVKFYEDPIAYLLSRRLGVYVREMETDVPDREPVELGGLETWRLGTDALEECLAGLDAERSERLARDRGLLPLGRYGGVVHAEVRALAEEIAAQARELRAPGPREALSVNHALPDGTRLTGEVGDRFGGRRVRHQYSGVSIKYQLRMWIPHLVLCWLSGEDAQSVLVGRGKKGASSVTLSSVTLSCVEDPADRLVELVAWYREGLRAPLRYAPGASYAYARAIADGKDDAVAIAKAQRAYVGDETGDVKFAPHLLRVFGKARPGFEEVAGGVGDFRELATTLIGPLVAAGEVS